MFKFLFKYPLSTFANGHIVLLGTWPTWVLWTAIPAAAAGLALLIWSRLRQPGVGLRRPRAAAIWLLQSLLAAVLLFLLWQPALTTTELKPQQDIILFLLDDSRSMAAREDGSTRQAQAVKALQDGALTAVQQKFQTRSEEHTSELQSLAYLVCRLLLEK